MSQKNHWQIKKLGEVCEIVNGSTPLRTNKDFWDNGNFPWFTIDDIRAQGRVITTTKQKVTEAALSKLKVLPIDTVLLCCTASVGEYAITKVELTTNQQFNGLIVKDKDQLHPEFLMYYCSTLKDKLLELSGKTTIDFIAISKIKNLNIPLPPLSEQKRIVAILDESFEAITKAKENTEQTLKNAKEVFESYLQGVFENKGDDWEEKKLGEVVMKPTKSEAKDFITDVDEVSFLPMEDLSVGDKFTKVKKVRKLKDVKGSYTYFYNGDILLAKVTPCFENGKLSIAQALVNNIGFGSSEYIVLRANKSLYNEYLYYFLSQNKLRVEGKNFMIGTSGLKRLPMNFLIEYLIPIPSLKEQQTIVNQLDALRAETRKLEEIYAQKLSDLEELKKSLLQKAFAGEL